jgi:hypothetical protein
MLEFYAIICALDPNAFYLLTPGYISASGTTAPTHLWQRTHLFRYDCYVYHLPNLCSNSLVNASYVGHLFWHDSFLRDCILFVLIF